MKSQRFSILRRASWAALRCVAIGLALAGLVIPLSARAASLVWSGTTDSSWSTTTNWNPVGTPGTGDTATFGGAGNGNTTISLGAGVTILNLQFDSASSTYTIGAGAAGSETLTLNHGGLIGVSGSFTQSDHLINAAVVLGTNANTGSYLFFSDANRTLTFAGPIRGGTGGIAGTKTLTVGLNGDSGNVVINGVIGGGSGTIALTKTGTHTLTLSGNNTFTGPLTFEGGTITVPVINNSNADGPLGHSTAAVEFAIDNALGGGVLNYTGGTATSSKRFTMTSAGTFNIDSAAADLTLTGVIDGTGGGLGKSGPGTLTLTAVNTYGPQTTISGGTLRLSGSGRLGATTNTLIINNGGKLDLGGTDQTIGGILTISGVGTIVNNGGGASLLTVNVPTGDSAGFTGSILDNDNATAGTVALTKTGAGSLGLGGIFANSNYSGATLVTNGSLGVASANALGSAATGTTVSSGATLQIVNTNIAAEPITISGVGETGYEGAIEGGNAIYGGLLKLNAASTVATSSFNPGPFDITNPGTITGATFTLTLAGQDIGSIASIIGTTSGGLTKIDAGTWTLSGANTYTGTTTISAGILNIQHANALGASTSNDTTITSGATLQIQGGITTPAAEGLTIRGIGAAGATGAFENVSGVNNWAGDVTLGADSTISSDSGTLNLTNTASTITGSTFDLTLTGAGDGSIASVLATTSGTVTKSGAGKWTLSGLNSFTGALTVLDGTLSVPTFNNASAPGPLGNSALAVTLGAASQTGEVEYTGATATSTKPFALTTGGIGAFDILSAATELTLTGQISGAGTLMKSGLGTLTLGSAKSFTGPALVAEGTLKLTAANAIVSTAGITVESGAVLLLAGTPALNRIADTDALALSGGTLSTEGLSNATETLGNFSLTLAHSTIDFGSGSGNSLFFAGVGTHTAGIKLAILNWSGTPNQLGSASSDRLIFSGANPSAFTTAYNFADVSFNGVTGYLALQADVSHYEIVAIPEPSAGGLLGVALLGAAGFCRRRYAR
ncbi:MAG: autotransporter-associated beta strand repeat-containing protein [Chthoniobacteraceae bacterium]